MKTQKAAARYDDATAEWIWQPLTKQTAGSGGDVDVSNYDAVKIVAARFRYTASAVVATRFPLIGVTQADDQVFETQDTNGLIATAVASVYMACNRVVNVAQGTTLMVHIALPTFVLPKRIAIGARNQDLGDVIDLASIYMKVWRK